MRSNASRYPRTTRQPSTSSTTAPTGHPPLTITTTTTNTSKTTNNNSSSSVSSTLSTHRRLSLSQTNANDYPIGHPVACPSSPAATAPLGSQPKPTARSSMTITTTATTSTTTTATTTPVMANNHHHNNNSQLPSAALSPVLPLSQLVSRPDLLHPEDETDHVLPIAFTILDHVGNKAMSVKELGETAFNSGYLRTSPSAASQSIGTHIRAHIARHADKPWNALLASYKLSNNTDDQASSPAINSLFVASRRGTKLWYISRAAGKPCPFERIGINVKQPQDPANETELTNSSLMPQFQSPSQPPSPLGLSGSIGPITLKRKIPPDDGEQDSHRPNKIRITLRLPPRTPIPKRPRPLVVSYNDHHNMDSNSIGDTDSSTADSGSTSDESEDASSDEDMLDDFNTLLANDAPISIPCMGTRPAGAHLGHMRANHASFFDTCEPPPDSEDEDDDFHNSMLRPEPIVHGGMNPQTAIDLDDELFLLKQEDLTDFEIKEEELAAIGLSDLISQPAVTVDTQPIKVEDSSPLPEPQTARPQLDWSGLKAEDAVFSPMEILTADNPASLEVDDFIATPSHPIEPSLSSLSTLPTSRPSIPIAPPPTPWIKTEEDTSIFGAPSQSPESYAAFSVIEEDEFNSIASPIPISALTSRPWENDNWTPIPGPESVSTDEVDSLFAADEPILQSQRNQIQASTSAPSLNPLTIPSSLNSQQPRGGRGQRPLRLSIGGLNAFNSLTGNHQASKRAGHARRHSHAAGVTPSNRRLSIISNAFSDWTTGTPEDAEAPLITPSHTGWRTYRWPPVGISNGSSTSLVRDTIDEKPSVVENGEPMDAPVASVPEKNDGKEDVSMASPTSPQRAQPVASKRCAVIEVSKKELPTYEELDRRLASPSFNHTLTKTLPHDVRISTLLLLGVPVYECRIKFPPIELLRRVDTDYVNISSIITLSKYLAHTTSARFRTAAMSPIATTPNSALALPVPPTADELPPNHFFVDSGAKAIHGAWIPLGVARSVVKNYHDLPSYVRRLFLSETLADKYPEPVKEVKSMITILRSKALQNGVPGSSGFGKPFANPSSLSARELLVNDQDSTMPAPEVMTNVSVVSGESRVGTGAGGHVHASGSGTGRNSAGTPLTLKTKGAAAAAIATGAPRSGAIVPLSPIVAVANANALLVRDPAPSNFHLHGLVHNGSNHQSLMSAMGIEKTWTAMLGKVLTEQREEEPLKPEEEEMLKAILKRPPRNKASSKRVPAAEEDDEDEAEEEEEAEVVEMSVDKAEQEEGEEEEEEEETEEKVEEQEEEEEVARSVVDIGSDMEQEEGDEEEEPTLHMTRSVSRKSQGSSAPKPNPDPKRQQRNSVAVPTTTRRSVRHTRSISSISSELTVSESESSASPPSLDSRPALKGKSTNHPSVPLSSASPTSSPDPINEEKVMVVAATRGRTRGRGRGRVARLSVGSRAQNHSVSDLVNRVRIIEVDEPVHALLSTTTPTTTTKPSPPATTPLSRVSPVDESLPGKLRRSERTAKVEPTTNGTADRALKRAALKEKAAATAVNVVENLGGKMKGRRSSVAAPTAASENDHDTIMSTRAGVVGSKRSLRPRP